MVSKKIKNGTRVRTSKKLLPENRDAGTVLDTNPMSAIGHEVLVRWDSGVDTWCDRARLFLER